MESPCRLPSGGKRREAMPHLAMAASPAPGARASDVRQLGHFVIDVLSILRSPINRFEGMLEAPSPIVRLYQAHRQSMTDLRPRREGALQSPFQDARAALYDGIAPIVWTIVEATGIIRFSLPEQTPGDAAENP